MSCLSWYVGYGKVITRKGKKCAFYLIANFSRFYYWEKILHIFSSGFLTSTFRDLTRWSRAPRVRYPWSHSLTPSGTSDLKLTIWCQMGLLASPQLKLSIVHINWPIQWHHHPFKRFRSSLKKHHRTALKKQSPWRASMVPLNSR